MVINIQKQNDNVFIICKFRYYILHTFDLISLTCICMATFDRYLISSREVRLRQLSTTRQQTKLIILFIICLIGLHSIPIVIYYDVSQYWSMCYNNSKIYLYYYLYTFQIFLHGIIPILFFSVFGILTYKQLKIIKHTNNPGNLNSDKQLSRMLLLICIAIIIIINSILYAKYILVIFTDINQQLTSYIFIFYYISFILFYTNPVFSFYVFFISTPNFRKQVKKIFQCKIYNPNPCKQSSSYNN